jgi:hypothetical protein
MPGFNSTLNVLDLVGAMSFSQSQAGKPFGVAAVRLQKFTPRALQDHRVIFPPTQTLHADLHP